MHCERARALLGPYLDAALPAQDRTVLIAHLGTCPSCARLAADWRRLARVLSAVGRQGAPPSLLPRLRRALAGAPAPAAGRPLRRACWTGPATRRWYLAAGALPRRAAPMLAACTLTAVATWWAVGLAEPEARLQHDVLAAHMRALLQESPTQVASADTHLIKPWFSGRVDFSPSVTDLAGEGFMLLGARLDYVGDRRVGVLVYRRRHHTINVFVWPKAAGKTRAGSAAVRKGYTLVTWTRQGLTYWAISDLDAGELETLQRLL